MEKLGIAVLCLIFMMFWLLWDWGKTQKKYKSLLENHERLKNDIKLLQQENYYLKQISKVDTYVER